MVCDSYFSLDFLKFMRVGFWNSMIKLKCFFHFISFFLIAINSHGNLHLALGLVCIFSAPPSIWVVTKFSYSSFGVCHSDVSWGVSNLFLTVTTYSLLVSPLMNEDKPWLVVFTIFFYFYVDSGESLSRRFCDRKILLQKRSMSHISKPYLLTYSQVLL